MTGAPEIKLNKVLGLIDLMTGQSNGFTRQDWDSTTSSSSPPSPASTRLRPAEKERPWWEEPPRQHRGHNKAAVSTSNVLFKVAKSEKDVIKDWLENIFKVRAAMILLLLITRCSSSRPGRKPTSWRSGSSS